MRQLPVLVDDMGILQGGQILVLCRRGIPGAEQGTCCEIIINKDLIIFDYSLFIVRQPQAQILSFSSTTKRQGWKLEAISGSCDEWQATRRLCRIAAAEFFLPWVT